MNLPRTRREFLADNAMGIGSVALAWMLQQEQLLAKPAAVTQRQTQFDLTPKQPHFAPRANAMISLFMHGGPAHMDLTDPKPELTKHDGQDYTGEVVYSFVNRASKKLLGSPWKFSKHGQCGTEISELLPHIADIVDDLCLIRSMHTGHNGHEVSIRYFHGGIPAVLGRPTLGSWLVYGLGCETQNLPAYMVLSDPGGHPVDGVTNWSNGFMPPLFQGTVLRPTEPRILNLNPPPYLKGTLQEQNLSLLGDLNRRHQELHPGEADLDARIASYELAARMQMSATDALDLNQETRQTQELYGIGREPTDSYGRRCLIARRLVERGVRFVQLYINAQIWDNHTGLATDMKAACDRTDLPIAGLIQDLQQRGLLDETLLIWSGEFGRLPIAQLPKDKDERKAGRDHNKNAACCWFAGGGVKGGTTYGTTDDLGFAAVDNRVSVADWHATILHLLGLNHEELFVNEHGLKEKLTGVQPARVVREILS
jgi:hypothetical protein